LTLERRPGTAIKVGLVWGGKAKPTPLRSVPFAQLAPLLAVEGVTFFSLQVGPQVADLKAHPLGNRLIDLSPQLTDFAQTAAAMRQLDLIDTIDTSAAHLAGALGLPVWTLLMAVPDWRWFLGRSDSPWYPSMRLFRQPKSGCWDAVVAEIAGELARFRDQFGPANPGRPEPVR
jgi:hypothetical protein